MTTVTDNSVLLDALRLARSERLKVQAMEAVEAGAQPALVAKLREAIAFVNEHHRFWTNDDVWDLWVQDWQQPMPPEPRLLGPLIQSARYRHQMLPTGEWVKSRRPECHHRLIPQYRSRVSQ